MGIQVTRSGTNWTVDVTALGLVNDTAEKDFLVIVAGVEQALAAYAKTTATVITYSGAALPANTVISFYRWGLRDIDVLQYGEVTSQLGMNRRLDQIERVLDDLREVKQFIWNVGIPGDVAVASHVALADPHVQYRLKSAAVPVSDLSGTLSDAQIPALIARDAEVAAAVSTHEALANPHPGYTTAGQLTAALTGYLPTTQKGAVNGIAPLDGSSKIPAINSRGCSAVYTASTGVWLFTWADGSTQSMDTPLELVFQSVNYNTTTKQVTFTLVGGATTSFSLADLVDLPEVQVATVVPSATPTTGQRLYIRSDTGEYWVSNGSTWAGPFLNLTAAERSQLAGLTTSLAGKQNSDPTLQSIADTVGTGVIQRNANETVTLLPTGPIAAPLLAAANAATARAVINAEPNIGYPKSNYSLLVGGLVTEERWVFIANADILHKFSISRGFSDDAYGFGALEAVVTSSNGSWGSAGGGSMIRIEKFSDFGWTGAFAGATNHLLREVRLVEGTQGEVSLSGVWLKLMGARTYKFFGCAAPPQEFATFQPTATLSTITPIPTPRGHGVIEIQNPDYNGPDFGTEVPSVVRATNNARFRVVVSTAGVLSTVPI